MISTDTEVDTLYHLFLAESTDDSPGCELVDPACSNQAVRRLRLSAPKGYEHYDDACHCSRSLLSCLPHMEAASYADALLRCVKCDGLMQLKSTEAIR